MISTKGLEKKGIYYSCLGACACTAKAYGTSCTDCEPSPQMCHTLTVQSSQLTAKCSAMSKAIKPVSLDAIRQACEVKMTGSENKALCATVSLHQDCFHPAKMYCS